MKILFFSYAYPNPINPGLGTFNRTMIAGLAQEHDVRVVSAVPFADHWKAWMKGRLPRGLNDSSFQAVPKVPAHYSTWYYTPKLFRQHYGRFMQRSVGATLRRQMREFQPDLVLSYWTHPDGEVAVRTAHELGIRAVTMVGGSDVLLNARTGSRRNVILNVLREADGVVTVSDEIKHVLTADGISAGKLFVARRGVDRRTFAPGDRNLSRQKLGLPDSLPILISVGRLVAVKGHSTLIESCRRLVERGVKFRGYLLGEGPLRNSLQRQIDQLGLTDVLEIKGAQTQAQLADWYRAADLSVLASLSEGVPNVLLESIASGTPFVASNVGGIPEIADPNLDRLVPVGDAVAMADAIAQQLDRERSCSESGRRYEPSSVSEAAEQLSGILQWVQAGRQSLLSDETIMHEMIVERHVDVHQNKPLKVTSPAEFVESDEPTSGAKYSRIRGRTGEGYDIGLAVAAQAAHSPASVSPADQESIEKAEEREMLKAAVAVVFKSATADDICSRTGERYRFHASPTAQTAIASSSGTNSLDLNDRAAFQAAMAAAFGATPDDCCVRTAERYRLAAEKTASPANVGSQDNPEPPTSSAGPIERDSPKSNSTSTMVSANFV